MSFCSTNTCSDRSYAFLNLTRSPNLFDQQIAFDVTSKINLKELPVKGH